jgi:hypothetical protein
LPRRRQFTNDCPQQEFEALSYSLVGSTLYQLPVVRMTNPTITYYLCNRAEGPAARSCFGLQKYKEKLKPKQKIISGRKCATCFLPDETWYLNYF